MLDTKWERRSLTIGFMLEKNDKLPIFKRSVSYDILTHLTNNGDAITFVYLLLKALSIFVSWTRHKLFILNSSYDISNFFYIR